MSWDEIVSALSMLWAHQKPELLQLLQPGLNKALRLALVGTALMAVLLAALLAEGSLPPGAVVPVWVGLDTGGERTYNAE